jgi:hypothetical protein
MSPFVVKALISGSIAFFHTFSKKLLLLLFASAEEAA